MKNEEENESLEIELEIESGRIIAPQNPKITVKKGIIAYQGFGPNASREIIISPSDFEDLFGDIESYRIAPFPKSPRCYLDGTFYTISIKNGMNSVTCRWHVECPPEWEKVGKLADKLIDYVKRNIGKL